MQFLLYAYLLLRRKFYHFFLFKCICERNMSILHWTFCIYAAVFATFMRARDIVTWLMQLIKIIYYFIYLFYVCFI